MLQRQTAASSTSQRSPSASSSGTRQAAAVITSGPRLGPYPASSIPILHTVRLLLEYRRPSPLKEADAMEKDNIFLRILDKSIPAKLVHEDDRCVAFRDLNPQAPVHVLIIPRKVIPTHDAITEADEELVGHLHVVAARLAKDLGLGDGYRLVINCRER